MFQKLKEKIYFVWLKVCLEIQVINLIRIYCFIKLVLNNLYFFNMFIQFKCFFFLDDIDIFNILEEIGMKEYKNVFKENMVRKN